MKFEQLEAIFNESQNAIAILEQEIETQEGQKAQAEAEAKEAAAAGDLATYKAHKAEADNLADSIFVKKSQLASLSATIPDEDAKDAWNDYMKTYRKNLSAALADLEQAQKTLFDKFIAVSALQNEARSAGATLAAYTGRSGYSHEIQEIFPVNVRLDQETNRSLTEFFIRTGKLNKTDLDYMGNVTNV